MMDFLLQLLIKLCDLACWLCSKRDGWTARLASERQIRQFYRSRKK